MNFLPLASYKFLRGRARRFAAGLACAALCLGCSGQASANQAWLPASGDSAAWLIWAGLGLFAYLLGSIPFGLVLAKTFCGIDPRKAGSGNIGTTNVARLCGLHWGVLTLLCDAFKGAVPVWLALHFLGSPFQVSLVGLCALIGHLWSIFLKFKGGKAVATTVGVFLPMAFLPLLISGVICLLAIWRTGFVSVGSLVLATFLPATILLFGRYELLPFSLIVLGLIVFKHRENIKRLLRGEEKSFLREKKAAAETQADAAGDNPK